MINCMKDCYRFEGMRGLYKGMGFPLATVSLVNAVVFSTNEATKVYLGMTKDNSAIEGTN